MLLSTKSYTWGKYFHLCIYVMTDSRLACTTHGKVLVEQNQKHHTVPATAKKDSQNVKSKEKN